MIILVTGTREATAVLHRKRMSTVLRWLTQDHDGPHLLRHGDAQGVDRLAAAIAESFGWTVRSYPADWAKKGRAAGPLRNGQMVAEQPKADVCVAFPLLPVTRDRGGTVDCMFQAMNAEIPVLTFPLTV